MKHNNPLKSLFKITCFSILLVLLQVTIQAYPAVLTSRILEMNNSFPPPDNPAVSPDTHGCSRAHQGLYNELVDCLQQRGDYVQVSYNNVTYRTDNVPSTFWTYKDGIMPLAKLEQSDLALAIPNPEYAQEPTIVLTYPWKGFSLGTRFRHLPEYDTQDAYAVIWADYDGNKVVSDFVERENAIQEIKQDAQATRQRFVTIINGLIDRVTQSGQNNVIPYVWGGSSFLQPYKQSDFYKKDGVWHRHGKNDPYTGYDCSEFIMRMAHIAGIDFPWKTTTAIKHGQRKLTRHDLLEAGDIIWVQGHVMTVSNIEHNEMIEPRGYGAGYGCVHRIKLNQAFEGITSYDDLIKHYYAEEPIMFKHKNGASLKPAKNFQLLKLIN